MSTEAEPRAAEAADGPWLTAREQRVWRSYLRAQSRIDTELDGGLRRGSGLTLVEYGILVTLSESADRRMRMRHLADSVLVSKSRLTHQIARLESAGHVRREPCEDDRRGFWAVLTDSGLAVLRAAAPAHAAQVRARVFDRLSPAQMAAFGEIMALLEADEPSPAPAAAPRGDGPAQ
ncbi:MarR family winged helix-turn-helix transcriptional regulator [Nocardiopsis coralliicola]